MSVRMSNSKPLTKDDLEADPVEKLAAAIYENEPRPPGPAEPPYGSDQTLESERERCRELARMVIDYPAIKREMETMRRQISEIQRNLPPTCAQCHGHGTVEWTRGYRTCEACGGKGY